ncbi:MAG: carbohydrate binding domain-containing protein, partial [Clostridia bacterium]|nr:carbohydrate binding domain-containing protein [Clostridia bacterium]
MRMKLIAWVMMMAIALSGMTALAQEVEMGYVSDFAQGEDGWYARSMGTAKVYVTEEKTLKIEGRTDNWNSPGRDFLLQQGTTYQLSVEVKQEQADAAKFMISVAHTAGGTES